jgi:hypothetical protein
MVAAFHAGIGMRVSRKSAEFLTALLTEVSMREGTRTSFDPMPVRLTQLCV